MVVEIPASCDDPGVSDPMRVFRLSGGFPGSAFPRSGVDLSCARTRDRRCQFCHNRTFVPIARAAVTIFSGLTEGFRCKGSVVVHGLRLRACSRSRVLNVMCRERSVVPASVVVAALGHQVGPIRCLLFTFNFVTQSDLSQKSLSSTPGPELERVFKRSFARNGESPCRDPQRLRASPGWSMTHR